MIPPGQSSVPYHYEHGEEEWMLVLDGRPSVRTPEGTTELVPLDVVFFPKGPEGAHEILNTGDAPARVLMWSTLVVPDGDDVPRQRQGRDLDRANPGEDLIVPRSAGVDYWAGHPGV